jgi:mannose-1-phosphate guanylyltransferase
MRALILAGGLGTRLRPLTDRVPKSLLPICNRPFLEHQVTSLGRHGVGEATLLTRHLAGQFEEFAGRASSLGVALDVSTESTPLDTAGAARSVLERLDGTTLVFNGDVLTEIDLGGLLAVHRDRGAAVTIALTYVEDSDAFGVVALDDDGSVREFRQNPKTGHAMPGAWINAGVYALEPRALEAIPPNTPWSFETQLFPTMLAAAEPLFGYQSDAYWIDVGTPQRYLQAHFDILSGRARFGIDGRLVGSRTELADGTVIEPPVLLSHAPVGRGAHLGPLASLAAGVRIGEGAHIERSVLLEGAEVGARAVVRESIIGAAARVDPGVVLEGQTQA